MFILPKSMWKGKLTQFYLTIEIFSSALTTYLFTFKMEKYTPIYLEFYSKQINLFWRKLLHWNVYPENLCWLLNSEPRKQQHKKICLFFRCIDRDGGRQQCGLKSLGAPWQVLQPWVTYHSQVYYKATA